MRGSREVWMRTVLGLALLIAGCGQKAAGDSASSSTVGETAAPTDSGTEEDSSTGVDTSTDSDSDPHGLPASCAPPDELPTDPITDLGQVQYTVGDRFFMELVDLEIVGERVWAVGQGGLLDFDISDPDAPVLANQYSTFETSRFHRVEPLPEPYVAATVRDERVMVFDTSTSPPTVVWELGVPGAEGLASHEDLLYLTARDTGLMVFDIADPAAPDFLAIVPGLDKPWELSEVVDGWMYAADAALGLVPIDLREPAEPEIGTPVPISGLQHVAAAGQHLYGSAGTEGIVVFDRSDSAAPVELLRVPTGGSVTMSAVDGQLLVAADHEGVFAMEVSNPTEPRLIGREETEQFALAVDVVGEELWVGDWTILAGMRVDAEVEAPELDLPLEELGLPEEGGETSVSLHNRGGAPLELVGATVSDDRVQVSAEPWVLEPGETGSLSLSYSGGEEPLDATLCLASSDPDESTFELPVRAGSSEPPIGEYAPDFELVNLATGETHRLSDHLGAPVMLSLFAYW